MEYLVPLAIVLVIVIAVIVAARVAGRKGRAVQDAAGPRPRTPNALPRRPQATREAAVEASARLTPEAHRTVYSLIAQQQVLNAVREYRKATHSSLGQAAAAVAALVEFPQPLPEPGAKEAPLVVEDILQAAPKPAKSKAADSSAAEAKAAQSKAAQSKRAADRPSAVKPVKPAEPVGEEPAGQEPAGQRPGDPVPVQPAANYRYRAIVSRGDEVREVASTRLNEEIFGRIRSLALSGDLDGAATLLRSHANVSDDDAREFVSMIGPAE